MPRLLRRIEKSEIDEAENQAFRHRVGCPCCLAKSSWLIAPFGTSAADFGEERASSGAIVFDIFDAGIHGSKKLYILGIKLELAESPV
jgi:hypothetical protein